MLLFIYLLDKIKPNIEKATLYSTYVYAHYESYKLKGVWYAAYQILLIFLIMKQSTDKEICIIYYNLSCDLSYFDVGKDRFI